MAKVRKCSICGETGHDARNCPLRDANEPKDTLLWFNIRNLTDKQADDITSAMAKTKRKIAPDAQVSFAKGDKKTLPGRINKALGLEKEDE